MISREDFVKLVSADGLIDRILDSVDYSGGFLQTETFIIHNEPGGDISIIDKYSLDRTPKVINWYKYTHVGRALNVYGFKDVEELKTALVLLNVELEDWWVK